ncbi:MULTISPECIES: nucleotide exchange factor GrpE [Microbacterium]|uniref:Protein GrpE n=1 Tax=Microbacterium wangchenii TaxID=2541726 RepID=A0ABX5SYR6_9MICO|nr:MULTISPECIES: nucleotide exchange factor GrpE [Microbacterium]MCK6066121.1 nucleotide exchange factor GrpE [Microbacterium sp. EYE_512]QBR90402.1 nucleotide exchange factor GrpE [Microbacterium wangchenii]TFV84791.1 nucleotide exchange factor GrpE [Microbacterium sp. dk485]TXK11582.1 nucleotide exchange factor GrpE [Microbacterium wangchenii]
MTNKDDATFPEPDDARGQGAAPDETTGSDADASGPAPSGEAGAQDDLTIDDILGTEQTADAAAEDLGSPSERADEHESALVIDLKRLQAEYANYRRRTEEQREREIERAQGEAAKGLLPVLDDLDRAAQHGDLQPGTPFAAIGDKVRAVAERLGVVAYGKAGELFDPQQHEAIFQAPTPGATEPTILEVVEVGYRLGSVELRPAKVVVAVAADPSTSSGD